MLSPFSFGNDYTIQQPAKRFPYAGNGMGWGDFLMGMPPEDASSNFNFDSSQAPVPQIPQETMPTTYPAPDAVSPSLPGDLGPFSLWGLTPQDISRARSQSNQAYGNQLMSAGFSNSWEGIGTGLARASQAKDALYRKSLEAASNQAMDTQKFLSAQDSNKIENALKSQELDHRTSTYAQDDETRAAVKSFLTDNSTINDALNNYQQAIIAEPDKNKAADMARKFAVTKATIAIHSAQPTMGAVADVMSSIQDLNKDLGDDSDFAEKVSKAERMKAAADGFGTGPTSVMDMRKSLGLDQSLKQESLQTQIAYRKTLEDVRKKSMDGGGKDTTGVSQGVETGRVTAERQRLDALKAIALSKGNTTDGIKAAAELGIVVNPETDFDDTDHFNAAVAAKIMGVDSRAKATANIEGDILATGSHVKGKGVIPPSALGTATTNPKTTLLQDLQGNGGKAAPSKTFTTPSAMSLPGFSTLTDQQKAKIAAALDDVKGPGDIAGVQGAIDFFNKAAGH